MFGLSGSDGFLLFYGTSVFTWLAVREYRARKVAKTNKLLEEVEGLRKQVTTLTSEVKTFSSRPPPPISSRVVVVTRNEVSSASPLSSTPTFDNHVDWSTNPTVPRMRSSMPAAYGVNEEGEEIPDTLRSGRFANTSQ